MSAAITAEPGYNEMVSRSNQPLHQIGHANDDFGRHAGVGEGGVFVLDVSATHPFVACAAFAVRWLGFLAEYDLSGAEALIDVNDSGRPFAESFPAPEGFTYGHPDRAEHWTLHIVAAGPDSLGCDFEVPFAEKEYRPMMARFVMRRRGTYLQVEFEGLVPS